jgi:KaiC/GvpD/RAD55 family RecA-like ATPase
VRDCNGIEIEYLREPELPKGTVVGVTGDSASGKSTLATAWARDVEGPVLFLDRENPVSIICDRLDRLGFPDSPRLRFWGGWCAEEAPQPDAPAVVEWMKNCGTSPLIVVDSLSGFYSGDQNDAAEMCSFMNRCRHLANMGATVMVIHHSGKADTSKDYRGSSDFKAAIDCGFHVSNYGDAGQLGTLVLRPFKMRVGSCGEISYSYAGGRIIRGNAAEVKQTVTEQLTALLRLNPGVTARRFDDLVNNKGLGRNRARSFLGDGLLSGSIRFEPGPRNAKRHFLAGMEAQRDR